MIVTLNSRNCPHLLTTVPATEEQHTCICHGLHPWAIKFQQARLSNFTMNLKGTMERTAELLGSALYSAFHQTGEEGDNKEVFIKTMFLGIVAFLTRNYYQRRILQFFHGDCLFCLIKPIIDSFSVTKLAAEYDCYNHTKLKETLHIQSKVTSLRLPGSWSGLL